MVSMNHEKLFKKESRRVAFDLKHRRTIRFNMSKYYAAVERGKKQFVDLEKARNIANTIKSEIRHDFSNYLDLFVTKFEENGGKVLFASTKEEAVKHILDIAKREKVTTVVKSKSITTEEMELNKHLENSKIDVFETDLGEFIVQVAGERPYHIVTPAMHKSKEDVFELFHKHFNTPLDTTPSYITNYVREFLRDKFKKAELGISGANFLVADVGGISLTENEGNALLSTSFPRIHIAIAGIEKLIPKYTDLGLFLPLLATHGTGQRISAYNTLITGPKKAEDIDGPEQMYLILLDNGRSDLYQKAEFNKALACIRCGACLNFCPIYQNIGGYTYETAYTGPIGSLISPHFEGMKEFKHLSFACTLCGKCTEECPVHIPLHELLLENRHYAIEHYGDKLSWTTGLHLFEIMASKRSRFDFFSAKTKNIFGKTLLRNSLGKEKTFPTFKKSFSKSMKGRRNVE
jgi:L-lactate dehydrogenase complex protein LldF